MRPSRLQDCQQFYLLLSIERKEIMLYATIAIRHEVSSNRESRYPPDAFATLLTSDLQCLMMLPHMLLQSLAAPIDPEYDRPPGSDPLQPVKDC